MKEREYRAVVRGPDGDCAEATGPLMDVIQWVEKFVLFLTDGFEVSVDQIREGSENGCIGIT